MDKIALFRDYLEKKPRDRFAMYSLAFELKQAGRSDEAEAAFRELLEAHPTSGAGHYQYGLLFAELDREDEARAAWEDGLQALAGVDDAEARRSIGEIEGALDDLD